MVATIYTIEIRCYEKNFHGSVEYTELVDCSFFVGENKEELIEQAKEMMEDKEIWYADNPYFLYKINKKLLSDLKYIEDDNDYTIPVLGYEYYPKYYQK